MFYKSISSEYVEHKFEYQYHFLEARPCSNYHQLFTKGRKIRASIIYGLTVGEDARTPEEVAQDYEIPLESVLEAIAYCESDPPEIQQDWEMEEASIRARGMNGSNSTGSTNSQAPRPAE